MARVAQADHQAGRPLPAAVLAGHRLHGLRPRGSALPTTRCRGTATTSPRAWPWPSTRRATAAPRSTRAYGLFYDNHITGIVGHHAIGIDGARSACARWCGRFPAVAWAPGARPATACPNPRRAYPEPGDRDRSRPRDARTRTRRPSGFDRALGRRLRARRQRRLRARQAPARHASTTTRVVPALGRRPRGPTTWAGVAGTSASVLQYTSFGETWYKGLTVVAQQALQPATTSSWLSYTLSKAEDNSTTSRAPSSRRTTGEGRNPDDPTGLPRGLRSRPRAGPARLTTSGTASCFRGLYQLPWDVQVSTIVTAASGRPFTPLAGADLNGDGNGGAFPPDRARRDPADPDLERGPQQRDDGQSSSPSTCGSASASSSAARTALDAIVEAFNLFNRANFSEVNNIFGAGGLPRRAADAMPRDG